MSTRPNTETTSGQRTSLIILSLRPPVQAIPISRTITCSPPADVSGGVAPAGIISAACHWATGGHWLCDIL
jgi:hypothetical protein